MPNKEVDLEELKRIYQRLYEETGHMEATLNNLTDGKGRGVLHDLKVMLGEGTAPGAMMADVGTQIRRISDGLIEAEKTVLETMKKNLEKYEVNVDQITQDLESIYSELEYEHVDDGNPSWDM